MSICSTFGACWCRKARFELSAVESVVVAKLMSGEEASSISELEAAGRAVRDAQRADRAGGYAAR